MDVLKVRNAPTIAYPGRRADVLALGVLLLVLRSRSARQGSRCAFGQGKGRRRAARAEAGDHELCPAADDGMIMAEISISSLRPWFTDCLGYTACESGSTVDSMAARELCFSESYLKPMAGVLELESGEEGSSNRLQAE